MKITVEVTQGELDDMGMSAEELDTTIVGDLDDSRDYSGYNVYVKVVDDEVI